MAAARVCLYLVSSSLLPCEGQQLTGGLLFPEAVSHEQVEVSIPHRLSHDRYLLQCPLSIELWLFGHYSSAQGS